MKIELNEKVDLLPLGTFGTLTDLSDETSLAEDNMKFVLH
jgi:hypothetical protein